MLLTKRFTSTIATLTAIVVLVLSMGIAQADIVRNDIVANGNNTIILPAAGGTGSTTVKYWIEETDANGCDVNNGSGNAATLSINPVANVMAQPSSLTFTSCGSPSQNFQQVTFSSSTPGDYTIGVSVSGGKNNASFNAGPATFTLRVKRPNTAPQVTVGGVADKASYEKGSVPKAVCNVSDAEDGSSTFDATLSAISGSLASYGLGSQTASCKHTDTGGLSGSASATYSIVDSTAPTLVLPGDITTEATGASGAVVTYSASATDAVDPSPTVQCSPASGGTFALGRTVINCTASDAATNTATGQFSVIVQDTTNPTLDLPGDQVVEATGPSGAVVTYSASASDTVDGAITPTCEPASGGTFPITRTPVNCSAADKAGNKTSGGFNIIVQDTTKPELKLPDHQVVEAASPDGAAVDYTATATDIVDGDIDPQCDHLSGATFGLGETTVSCTATDKAGNTRTGSFTIEVVDTTKPDLQLPGDITEEATKEAGADIAFSPSASDLVDGNVPVKCEPTSGGTFAIGTTTVNCSATDKAGNTAEGSFKVIVRDTTPPSFADVPGNQVVEATGPNGAAASYAPPTATDIVDRSRPVTCSPASGALFGLGATTVTCTTSDTRGNATKATFIVKVVDTTPPEVKVPDNITEEATSASGATASWTGVSAHDIVDGDLESTCNHASGETFPLGVTTVTCTVSDEAGNEGSNAFTVNVQDTTAPKLTVPADMVLEATGPSGAAATWSASDVSAHDAVDGERPVECDHAPGDIFSLGETTVECTASDTRNNVGYGSFIVKVMDTTAPEIIVPADFMAEATGPKGAAASYSVSATDIVDGAVTPSCTPASGSTFHMGDNAVTCVAKDNTGNLASKTFTITVVDTTPPAITVPTEQKAEATSAEGAVVSYDASATDLVEGDVTVECFPGSGTTFPLGATKVTCSASDSLGNAAGKTFDVIVSDTTAPAVKVPSDLTVFATSASGATVTHAASADDLVDGPVNPSCDHPSGGMFSPGATTVKCTATDAHGNTSSLQTFRVTVKFDFKGFFAPVDTNKVLNGMKGGSTVPLKWAVSDQKGGYISDLVIVDMNSGKTGSAIFTCSDTYLTDELASYSTGGTSLRYDSSANQFIYNWQSPKNPNTCYRVRITLIDGNSYVASFQLR